MSRRKLLTALGILVLLLASEALHAEDRAILIGAGRYASGKWSLDLVDENLRIMENALTGEIGVAGNRVVTLANQAVTRTGVIRALRQAARDGKAGDRLFVYYTGHATKVIVEGAPVRGYFTWDTIESDRGEGFDRETLFTDIDLRKWIAPVRDKGIVVIVFREACFSGGGYAQDISALSPGKPPVREPVGDIEISACDVDEAAWALDGAPKPVALFTSCLARELSSDRQKITARALFDILRSRVSRLRTGQTPILDCSAGIDPARVVLVDRTVIDLIVDVTDSITGEAISGATVALETVGSTESQKATSPGARFLGVRRQARVFPWIEKAGYLPRRHAVEVPGKERTVRTSVALKPEVAEVKGRIAVDGNASFAGVAVTYESGARPIDARHVDRETAVGSDGVFVLRVPPRAPCRITVVRGADTLASVDLNEGKDLEPVRYYDAGQKRWAGRSYDMGAIDIDPYLLGVRPKADPAPDRRKPLPETRVREQPGAIGLLKEWRIETRTTASEERSEMRETLSRLVEGGRVLYKTERKGRTELVENGKIRLVSMEEWFIEDEKDRVVEMFRSMPDLDGGKELFHLVTKGHRATLVSRSGAQAEKRQVDWDRGILGPVGVLSLRKEMGFELGTTYSYEVYVLPFAQATKESVEVIGREMIHTADGKIVNAHRLDIHQHVGFGIDRTEWCDDHGETIKTSYDHLLVDKIEIFRRSVAPTRPAGQGVGPGAPAGEEEFWKSEQKVQPQEKGGIFDDRASKDEKEFWTEPYPGFRLAREELFSTGRKIKKIKIYEHQATGLEFVLVPGAYFTMGTAEGAPGRYGNEGPEHRVKIKPFLLCRTECTQAAWDRIGGSDIRQWKAADLPIERVSWDDCTAWCRKAGLRLPTEAEWEYACRAGTDSAYYSGNGESDLDAIGWYLKNADRRTHTVGKKKPNALGLYDMSGNVWEWCEDTWNETYVGAPEDGSAWIGEDASKRVARGACWESQSRYCRSFTRNAFRQGLRDSSTGFRPAFSVQ